jgi:hypothetical protein
MGQFYLVALVGRLVGLHIVHGNISRSTGRESHIVGDAESTAGQHARSRQQFETNLSEGCDYTLRTRQVEATHHLVAMPYDF